MNKTKHFRLTALHKSAKSMVSTMLLLIAMLMPQGALAENFISEVKISANPDKATASNRLTNDHYTIVKGTDGNNADLNGGAGSSTDYIYIGYKTSTNAADAITGLLIVESNYNINPEFNCHDTDHTTTAITYQGKQYYRCTNYGDALDSDINRHHSAGKDMSLYYTKEGNTTNGGTPLLTITLVGNTTTTGVTYARHWQYATDQYGTSSTDVYGNTNHANSKVSAHYITYTTHTHSYNNSATFNWASDGKTCTADIYCTCGDKHTGIACTVTSAVKTPATCSVKGWTTYTAKVTYNGKNFSGTKDMQDIPLAEHTFNANGVCTRDASHFQEPSLSSGYYQIANYGNLCWFRDKVNGGSYTINAKQTADITIPDGVTWDGIGGRTINTSFKGIYDGNSCTISGSKITQDNTAFFNYTYNATIKNLGLLNVSVSSGGNAGLVRTADNYTTISNCYVTGSAERPLCYTNLGKSTITNCFANVTNGLYLVASNYATITNCYTNLSKINNAGSGTASNCKAGVNAATFASGEITYLLNSGKTDGTQVWYQKLGNGGNALPTLVKNISNTVYKLENLKCDGVTKNGSVTYSNSSQPNVDAHNWTNTTTYSLSAADCTHDAVYYKACSVCNVKGSETWTATGTALGHDHSSKTTTATYRKDAATCTTAATYWYKCSRCNDKSTTSFYTSTDDKDKALSHNMTEHAAKPATCTEDGNLLYYTCSRACCSDKYYKDNTEHTTDAYADFDATVREKLNHDYGAGVWSWGDDCHSATCTITCSRDANHKASASVTLGNGITSVKLSDPTSCAEKGKTRYSATVTVEGTQYSDTKEKADIALPHTFATDDESQSKCTICNHGFFRYTADAKVEPKANSLQNAKGENIYDSENHTFANEVGVMEFKEPLAIIGNKAFEERGFRGNLTIPSSVTSIGDWAFAYNYYLTGNLTIPNSVISIGYLAFNRDGFKGKLTIGNSVTRIANFAFQDCNKLTDVEMKSVPQMGQKVFYGFDCPKTVVLSDDSYVYTGSNPEFPEVTSVTYTRENIKNEWGTIVAPFKMGNGDDYDLYTLSEVSADKLTLAKVSGTIEAGTPVIFRVKDTPAPMRLREEGDDEPLSITFKAATNAVNGQGTLAGSAAGGLQLIGTYQAKELTDDDYFISNNKFWSVADFSGSTVKAAPFRAYLHSTGAGAKASSLSISIADGNATAIDTLNAITEGAAEYYDLSGKRILKLQKGINIVKYGNGKTKKVVIK